MFGLSRLYVGLLGVGLIVTAILYHGYSWGRQSQQAKIAQQQTQILTLHQAINDMTTASREQQAAFNKTLRDARESSGPVENDTENDNEVITKNESTAPVDKPIANSRVPKQFKHSRHCRDCSN